MSTSPQDLIHEILKDKQTQGFECIGLKTPLSFGHYENWVKEGHHGTMDYLHKNQEVRKNPNQHFQKMKSLIVFRQNYFPHPIESEFPLKAARIAHYARGKDYHFWFREKMTDIITELEKAFPEEEFKAFTDALPLLERDHAYQAGLGWIGKNTCLIDRKEGSLFFIGEIFTSLEFSNTPEPLPDFCGTCTACMDACPTQAFEEERVLNATKCISYWNIESKEPAPENFRESMGDWLFGCDICQTVCPWNIRLFKDHPSFPEPPQSPKDLTEELRMILSQSNKQLMRLFAETPLTRAGGRGLKKNALIVIGNLKLKELSDEVESYIQDPLLGELASWTLSKLQ